MFTNRKSIPVSPTNQRTVVYRCAGHVTFLTSRLRYSQSRTCTHLLLSITKRRPSRDALVDTFPSSCRLPSLERRFVMAAPDVPRNTPWHAAYPAPKSEVDALPRHDLLRWLTEEKLAGRDFALVDVRRDDFEVTCIYASECGAG